MSAARQAIMDLLATRDAASTICPSEAARQLASDDDWRARMPAIHAATDELLAEGRIAIGWKGERLAGRNGPYRIGRAGP